MEKVKRVRVTVVVRGGRVAVLGADGRRLTKWLEGSANQLTFKRLSRFFPGAFC
jgi:hypothetical protein